jgi:hypothetical protein
MYMHITKMNIYIHIYIYIYMYIYTHTHTYIYIYIIQTYRHTDIHTHITGYRGYHRRVLRRLENESTRTPTRGRGCCTSVCKYIREKQGYMETPIWELQCKLHDELHGQSGVQNGKQVCMNECLHA